MALDVIGAGFGRTGTMSMQAALEQLGYVGCHHMGEVMKHPEQAPVWDAAADGEPIDWEALLAGYRATVDWPSAYFWRTLADRYPDGKVLLTTRPPEKWWASMEKTILALLEKVESEGDAEKRARFAMPAKIIDLELGGDRSKESAIAAFERREREVREAIPAERLLVFDVAEGWAPLCAFLGHDVPETDFPRINTSDDFIAAAIEPEKKV